MKKLLILSISIFSASTALGQSVTKIKYTIDTLRFEDRKVAIRRSSRDEQFKYEERSGVDTRVAYNINKLQEQLDAYRQAVEMRQPLSHFEIPEGFIYDILKATPKFDLSLYENELAFYKTIADPEKNVYSEASDLEYVSKNDGWVMPASLLLRSSFSVPVKDFCESITKSTPGYQLSEVDTTSKPNYKKYTYKNATGNTLSFEFFYEKWNDNDEQTVMTRQSISADKLTSLRIYNAWFDKTKTPDEFKITYNKAIYKGRSYYYQVAQYQNLWTINVGKEARNFRN